MKLLLLRHGEASFDAPSDQQRRLTARGVEQVAWLADHLGHLDLSKVFCSPYTRTQQTLETLLPGRKKVELVEWLTPDTNIKRVIDELQNVTVDLCARDVVLCITHQPLVSNLISKVTGQSQPMMPSSLAELEFEVFAADLVDLIKVVHPSEHV